MNHVPSLVASRTNSFLHPPFDAELHLKTLLSLHGTVLGTLHSAQAGVEVIACGLACARGLHHKHAINQVDRLLRTPNLDPVELTPAWVSYVLGQRTDIVVAWDWTEFAQDGHSTIALSLLTEVDRATPLVWMTVPTENIERIETEDELLEQFRAAIPEHVRITLLADRDFGNNSCYAYLQALKIDYVIRIKESTLVTDSQGVTRPARECVPVHGQTNAILNARLTVQQRSVGRVVYKGAVAMKPAWWLASSRADLEPSEIVNLYGLRFPIGKRFRYKKHENLGMGLMPTRIHSCDHRDRLLLGMALAQVLLHILGAAGESLGMDRYLKANTHPGHAHSLYGQGEHYYDALLTLQPEAAAALLTRFDKLLRDHPQGRHIVALL